ncbi:DUF1496 domain-containing protein [Hydrogenophaga crassostreae]|nr:DUF1496 domain-containing protein [Hydrogenophaga crassostreae]
MTTCIYGSETYEEGAVICVNGRGLRCVQGEWQETGQPCGEADADGDATGAAAPVAPRGPSAGPEGGDAPTTKAKR